MSLLPQLVMIFFIYTCDRNIPKQKTPAQAVWKKLVIFPVPDVLFKLKRLEKVLISRRTLFKKLPLCQ